MKTLILTFLIATAAIANAQPLTSTFAFGPLPVCIGQDVALTYTGNGTPLASYYWNFNSAQTTSGIGQGPFLIQWDTVGTFTISLIVIQNLDTSITTQTIIVESCTGIENIKKGIWQIYPNPATDNIYIKSKYSNTVAEICDLTGKVLLKKEINNDFVLDISLLEKGFYVLHLTYNNETTNLTLIKQ